jgi:YidC/Oxa1 family membrane protein insertase
VVGAPFLPLAVLLYWVSNNLWTLGQQYVVYRRIDEEETAKRDAAVASQQARAPRPGQKPVRPEPSPAADAEGGPAKTPGAKPVTRKAPSGKPAGGSAAGNGAAKTNLSKTNLSKTNVSKTNVSKTNSVQAGGVEAGGATDGAKTGKTPNTNGTGSSNGSRPPVRRGRKRR